ncbi:MAG: tetratricopeptide repeat protein, partial [Anaerolineae bacterium]|nr:tetratricopeptide repeat protein [Anaerolineae bacterium]
AVEEPFGWVAFGEAEAVLPAEEKAPPAWLEGEELLSGEEALAWLEQPMRGKEEELQEQARLEAEARLAEIMGRPAPPPEERVEVPPVVPPEAPPAVEEPFGWVAFGEAEAVLPAEEKAPPAWLAGVEAAPEVLVEALPAAPEPVPQPPPAVESVAERRSYLKKHPRDYDAWLELAKLLGQTGKWDEALEAYSHLVRTGQLLEDVISDLERRAEQRADPATWRVLGDAYMKGGRLQEALEVYRRALEAL